jgi:hypothetical protein
MKWLHKEAADIRMEVSGHLSIENQKTYPRTHQLPDTSTLSTN